jgi:hypothetical protein
MGDQVRTIETVNYRYNNVLILQIRFTHVPFDRRKGTGREPFRGVTCRGCMKEKRRGYKESRRAMNIGVREPRNPT